MRSSNNVHYERYHDPSRVPLKLMNDEDVFKEELEKIFSRSWVFLGLADEIPNRGDFVVRKIGPDSFMVIRGEDDRIRGFFNSCRHMGTELCEAERGNAKSFTCPYHGWTYDNRGRLIGVPVKEVAYRNLDMSRIALEEIRVETYENLIFGNMNKNAISLEEYLGEMRWYLDVFYKASGGVRLVGEPFRFVVDCDWKSPAANFAEDRLHTMTSHKSVVELGYSSPLSRFGYVTPSAMVGRDVSVSELKDSRGKPVSAIGIRFPPDPNIPGYFGFYGEWYKGFRKPEGVSEDQFKLFTEATMWVFTVFPNFSMFIAADQTDSPKSGRPNAPVSEIRLWNPLGPGVTEIWTWVVVPKLVPDEIAKRVYEITSSHFGPAGVAEMDDTTIWRKIAKSARGIYSRKVDQLIFAGNLGLSDLPTLDDWPGPGLVRGTQFHEEGVRTFWRRWLIEMGWEGRRE